MNREMIAKVRDRIAEVGNEHCSMGSWVSNEHVVLPGSGPIECGTTACIAGHTLAVAEQWFLLDRNTSEGIKLYTKRYLGLKSDHLLFTEFWPLHYQEIASREGDAKGMVAILDDILDGFLDPDALTPID